MNNDIISRQALLDAVDSVDWYHQNKNGEMVHGANDDEHQAWYKAEDIYKAIESVPPVQLAQDLPKCCTDTISRAAVGDALNRIEISRNASWYEFYQKALTAVGTLPSAQPKDECEYWDSESSFCALHRPPAQPVEDARAMCGECDAWNRYKNYPQPGWIPCSERLPGKDESFYVLCCDKYGEIMIGNVFECYDGETPYSAESENEYMYDCVAWMPLPTPYREGGQDGKN